MAPLPKQPHKVLFLITSFGEGGAEKIVCSLANGLDRARFAPLVASLLEETSFGESEKLSGIPLTHLDMRARPVRSFLQLVRLLRRERPTIVHTNLFHADLVGRCASLVAGVPIVVSTVHNTSFGSDARARMLALTRSLVKQTVGISLSVKDYILGSGVSPEDRTSLIYYGLLKERSIPAFDREAVRASLGINPGDFMIVAVGRLIRQKGFEYLIKAVRLLSAQSGLPPVKLVIAGEGKEKETLFLLAQECPPGAVVFAGYVPVIAPYLSAADVFAMPSLWEGYSLALAEAAAHSLPIVATPTGIAPELFAGVRDGLLVPPGDEKALASALREIMLLSPEDRKKIGEKIAQRLSECPSVESMVKEYERLYTRLIEALPS